MSGAARQTGQGMRGMQRIQAVYGAEDGRSYPLEIGYALAERSAIPQDRASTRADCGKGCPNFGHNGGCPPHGEGWDPGAEGRALVVYLRLFTRHYPAEVLDGPYEERAMFSEKFFTALANRVGLGIAARLGGVMLGAGQCKGCAPDECVFARGEDQCARPERRWLSLSGAGVLAGEAIAKFFGLELIWWRSAEPEFTPEYVMKLLVLEMAGHGEAEAQEAVRAALEDEGLAG